MFGFTFTIDAQKTTDSKTQQIYGNWEFKYLLLNGKKKIWELASDKSDFDYMNIYFKKDTFDVQGTLVMKFGKITINNDSLFFKSELSIDDIIPKDLSTDYKRNIGWTRNIFEGKCFYDIEKKSKLKLYKTSDSILVFNKFQ